MCPAPYCESHPLDVVQEAGSFRIRDLGGQSKKSDQDRVVKNDTDRNNGLLPWLPFFTR